MTMRPSWQVMVYFAALTLPLVLAALGQVRLRQEVLAQGYRLSQAEQQRDLLRAKIRKAEFEHAAGRTPVRLHQAAKAQGLVPPRPEQLLDSRDPSTKLSRPQEKSFGT